MGSGQWLERYQGGHRAAVWHELRQIGERVREPEFAADAQAVCDEMAMRVGHNMRLVVARLRAQGYRFHVNDDRQDPVDPWQPPGADAEDQVRWLEQRFGPIPMALSSWIRLVGDVWLVGTHPRWPESSDADPLVLEAAGTLHPGSSIRSSFEQEHEMWEETRTPDGDDDPFLLPLAPDRLHKANVSGGGPYGMPLPDRTAEGLFVGEVAMPFVAYLNRVFSQGGFPGDTDGEEQWEIRASIAGGLLPL